ncbi:hypothetical protein BJY04DRAFT_38590 [Aspergillus karnatakaensis]|uniref:uncharacterized protein n=1 Tax=Aspergillus karnatakaensis TaxID=1810916 RepID=UPI003CCDD0ED
MPPASMNLGKRASSRAVSTRNTALLTIAGVIGAGYATLRYQSPRGDQGLVKEDDLANATGATKLGRSKIVSKDDAKAMMGDPPTGHGHIGRSPRQASNREDF